MVFTFCFCAGEKKRVNIGLELMARYVRSFSLLTSSRLHHVTDCRLMIRIGPKFSSLMSRQGKPLRRDLTLLVPKSCWNDLTTSPLLLISGLDSSSAMLVMQSMKTLVEVQGITVCSVIHQVRMVCCNLEPRDHPFSPPCFLPSQPRKTIFELFDSLVLLGAGGFLVYHGKVRKAQKYFWSLGYDLPEGESLADWLIDISTGSLKPEVFDDDSDDEDDYGRGKKSAKKRREKRKGDSSGFETSDEEDEEMVIKRSKSEDVEEIDPELLATDAEKEAARRQKLYDSWRRYFRNLSKKKRSLYRAPKAFDLPSEVDKPAFLSQCGYQIHRLVLLGYRNWYAKLLDTTIIVGAVILVSVLDGVVKPTDDADMNGLDYYSVAQPR